MTTTIPGLTGQTTTEDADLIVLQNTAANRTRSITVANFRNELAADMDIVTTAELNLAIANVTAAYQAADNALKELLFPVGTKISASSGVLTTTNPSVVWGFGTWVKEEGKYYVGHKTGDTNFGTIGGVLGTVQHNHLSRTGGTALNLTQIPEHNHVVYIPLYREVGVGAGHVASGDAAGAVEDYHSSSTFNAGGSQPHDHPINNDNHLPPSIVEVVWRRTA